MKFPQEECFAVPALPVFGIILADLPPIANTLVVAVESVRNDLNI